MKYTKLITAGAIAVLLSACTGENDQVATLLLILIPNRSIDKADR